MPFSVPTLDKLISYANTLLNEYPQERLAMDENRFLASLRSKTDNKIRKSDITFIYTVAMNINKNQHEYITLARAFSNSSNPSPSQITEFLRRALAGAFLLHLDKVDQEYFFKSSVKDRSALAKLTCALFGVEKMSEIPQQDLKTCLRDLKVYLNFMTTNSGANLKWHEKKTNANLMKEISLAIEQADSIKSTSVPTLG